MECEGKVIADCTMCGEHREVAEFIKNIDGKAQVIHICNECANWMQEVVDEYYRLKESED